MITNFFHQIVFSVTLTLQFGTLNMNTPYLDKANEQGLAIAVKAEEMDNGYKDFTADLTMILRNRQGEESTRHIRSRSLEIKADGDKTMIVFDRPRDIKGTALLTHGHITEPDDQWLFLPALNRVKRIASNNKSGPFLGSEFAYEDIASPEIEKYTHTYLREEMCNALICFVNERIPIYEHSGYSRQEVWIDKKEYRMQKVDYYDKKNELLKTLTFLKYEKYQNRYWRSGEMHMVNHQTGKSTTLIWENFKFTTGLTERNFDKNSLRRFR